MAKEESVKWTKVEEILQKVEKYELIDIIRDFYEHPAENRQIIISRHMNGKKKDWVMESFQRVIRNEFFPDKGLGGLHLVEFVNEYGDIDEGFIDEGYETLRKFCELLKTPEGQRFYPNFKSQLLKLRRESDDIGYGFGDDIAYYVEDIEDFFEEN
jgi:hypothetical protein